MPRIQVKTDKKKGKGYQTYSLNIPKEIMDLKGWKAGDELKFVVYKGGLLYISKAE